MSNIIDEIIKGFKRIHSHVAPGAVITRGVNRHIHHGGAFGNGHSKGPTKQERAIAPNALRGRPPRNDAMPLKDAVIEAAVTNSSGRNYFRLSNGINVKPEKVPHLITEDREIPQFKLRRSFARRQYSRSKYTPHVGNKEVARAGAR